MRISKHISYKEGVRSNTATRWGLFNIPNREQLTAMQLVAKMVFEPLRKWANVPLFISSFFRSIALNKKIGGSMFSQHCKGEAIDIDADRFGGVTNGEIFHYILNNLEFDQLIAEYPDKSGKPRWIHVSYSKRSNRGIAMIALKVGRKTTYQIYDPKKHNIT